MTDHARLRSLLPTLLALLLATAGCSDQQSCPSPPDRGTGDDSARFDSATRPDSGAPATPVTDDQLFNACVRLTACGIKAYTRVGDCAAAYLDLHVPQGLGPIHDQLYHCVNAARGDCEAIARCAGRRGECTNSYKASCDGEVAVGCDLLDKRVYAINCALAGLKCGVRQGQTFSAECGAGPCSASSYKPRCQGERFFTCAGGMIDVHDCLRDGKFCWGGDKDSPAGCRGNRRAGCAAKDYKPSCVGAVAVTCLNGREQWTDCTRRKLLGTSCNTGNCVSSARACSSEFDRCQGDRLETCSDGAWRQVDCLGLGLKKCKQVNYSGRCTDPAGK